jgi:diaminopimelate decarboxylase
LNLGGGWNNSTPNTEYSEFTATEIVSYFLKILKQELTLAEYPELIFEPGQAIVSTASCTMTTVTSIKSDSKSGFHWTHVDASTMTTTPIGNSLLGFNYEISNFSNSSGKVIKTAVVGAPCMGGSLAQDLQLPVASEGDLLVIWDTGAYSYGLQNDFNGYSGATELWLEDLMTKQRGDR